MLCFRAAGFQWVKSYSLAITVLVLFEEVSVSGKTTVADLRNLLKSLNKKGDEDLNGNDMSQLRDLMTMLRGRANSYLRKLHGALELETKRLDDFDDDSSKAWVIQATKPSHYHKNNTLSFDKCMACLPKNHSSSCNVTKVELLVPQGEEDSGSQMFYPWITVEINGLVINSSRGIVNISRVAIFDLTAVLAKEEHFRNGSLNILIKAEPCHNVRSRRAMLFEYCNISTTILERFWSGGHDRAGANHHHEPQQSRHGETDPRSDERNQTDTNGGSDEGTTQLGQNGDETIAENNTRNSYTQQKDTVVEPTPRIPNFQNWIDKLERMENNLESSDPMKKMSLSSEMQDNSNYHRNQSKGPPDHPAQLGQNGYEKSSAKYTRDSHTQQRENVTEPSPSLSPAELEDKKWFDKLNRMERILDNGDPANQVQSEVQDSSNYHRNQSKGIETVGGRGVPSTGWENGTRHHSPQRQRRAPAHRDTCDLDTEGRKPGFARSACKRHRWAVTFAQLGRNDILHPTAANDFGYCSGRCDHVLDFSFISDTVTAHSVLVNLHSGRRPKSMCSPHKMASVSIIRVNFFKGTYIVENLHNAVVVSCRCT